MRARGRRRAGRWATSRRKPGAAFAAGMKGYRQVNMHAFTRKRLAVALSREQTFRVVNAVLSGAGIGVVLPPARPIFSWRLVTLTGSLDDR